MPGKARSFMPGRDIPGDRWAVFGSQALSDLVVAAFGAGLVIAAGLSIGTLRRSRRQSLGGAMSLRNASAPPLTMHCDYARIHRTLRITPALARCRVQRAVDDGCRGARR